MKRLIIGLLVISGLATQVLAQVPPELKQEMRAEPPEQRGPAIGLSADRMAVILYYPIAKLWVVTKIYLFAPAQGSFRDEDIESIFREESGKLTILYKKKRGEKT